MSYILFGGLFDPPHLGHLEIASAAYNAIKPEILIWIPSKSPPHRNVSDITSCDVRFEMLKWWLKDYSEFAVSDIEISENHSGYSCETIERYVQIYPGKKSYFLIGTDEAKNFNLWKEHDKILKQTTIVIGRRYRDLDIPLEVKENVVFLDNSICEVSSSEVRRRLYEGKEVAGLLDERLINYIKEKKLYGGQK